MIEEVCLNECKNFVRLLIGSWTLVSIPTTGFSTVVLWKSKRLQLPVPIDSEGLNILSRRNNYCGKKTKTNKMFVFHLNNGQNIKNCIGWWIIILFTSDIVLYKHMNLVMVIPNYKLAKNSIQMYTRTCTTLYVLQIIFSLFISRVWCASKGSRRTLDIFVKFRYAFKIKPLRIRTLNINLPIPWLFHLIFSLV